MTRTEIEAWRDHDREMIGYIDMTDEDKEEFDEAFNSMLDQYLEEHNEIIEDEPGDSNDGDVPPDDDFSKTKDVQERLSREINEQIDSKIERSESRQEFQENMTKRTWSSSKKVIQNDMRVCKRSTKWQPEKNWMRLMEAKRVGTICLLMK